MPPVDQDRGSPVGFVIVSGLPASGKSRLGAVLAPLLCLPMLDKDAFLEALFEGDGVGDATDAQALAGRIRAVPGWPQS